MGSSKIIASYLHSLFMTQRKEKKNSPSLSSPKNTHSLHLSSSSSTHSLQATSSSSLKGRRTHGVSFSPPWRFLVPLPLVFFCSFAFHLSFTSYFAMIYTIWWVSLDSSGICIVWSADLIIADALNYIRGLHLGLVIDPQWLLMVDSWVVIFLFCIYVC